MKQIPFLTGNIGEIDKEFIDKLLNEHLLKLCHAQENTENDWNRRRNYFRRKIHSTDPGGVDVVIKNMIAEHKAYSQLQFSSFNINWKPYYNESTITTTLNHSNIKRSRKVAQKYSNECITEFNRQVGITIALRICEPEKYGKLIKELELRLRQYYDKLPWPLNDQTIGEVDTKLQQIFNQVLHNLFTPEVRERLKRDRMQQMTSMSKLQLDNNESLLWIYCVGCRRIFAGRTRGCVNVTCCHFTTKFGTRNIDHGCGLTFEWAKAQPVPIETLSPDIWISNIERDERNSLVQDLISAVTNKVRSIYSANDSRQRSRSCGDT